MYPKVWSLVQNGWTVSPQKVQWRKFSTSKSNLEITSYSYTIWILGELYQTLICDARKNGPNAIHTFSLLWWTVMTEVLPTVFWDLFRMNSKTTNLQPSHCWLAFQPTETLSNETVLCSISWTFPTHCKRKQNLYMISYLRDCEYTKLCWIWGGSFRVTSLL